MDDLIIINKQLTRIRAMNKFYHQQFLLDVRIFLILTISLFYLTFTNNKVFLLLPPVCLFGAILLAFHSHYLIFSRYYSEYLENKINNISNKNVLITHKLENDYFFSIKDKKLVVANIGKKFTWFSFVTLFITFIGIFVYIYSINQVIQSNLSQNYLLFMFLITLITLIIGIWWFLLGNGEKRLEKIFNEYR